MKSPTLVVNFNTVLRHDYIKGKWLHIPMKHRSHFPAHGQKVDLETDLGLVTTTFKDYSYKSECGLQSGDLRKWFKAHPEIMPGTVVHISVLVPKRKYRLAL